MTTWLLQKPLVSDSKLTSSIQYRSSRALAAMDNIEALHNKNIVVAETVGFRFEADFSSNQYRSSRALAVMDNIEALHHKKTVAADIVGFKFEADLFKSVPMIFCFGCHGKH